MSADAPDPSQPPVPGAAKPLKPWQSQGEPIVRFRTDEGKVYGSPSHSLATLFDEVSRVLAVECHHGIILITGRRGEVAWGRAVAYSGSARVLWATPFVG